MANLPKVGDEVKGDYIVYKDSAAESWRMLGDFQPKGSDGKDRKILIGFIPENYGGIQPLIQELQSGTKPVETMTDYVAIKREIRNAGGAYRDFKDENEFFKFQKEMEVKLQERIAELEATLSRLRR